MGVVCTENVPFFRDFMITMEQKKSPGCFSLPPENFSEDFYVTINFHQGHQGRIGQSNFNFVFFFKPQGGSRVPVYLPSPWRSQHFGNLARDPVWKNITMATKVGKQSKLKTLKINVNPIFCNLEFV